MESRIARVDCAWCGRVIREVAPGLDEGAVSHGFCTPCVASSGLFDVEDVHGLSRADFDRLPLGAIEVDAAGTVVRYNRAEEALSGRSRDQTLGRNFFHEVAPCTLVQGMESEYRALVDGGGGTSQRLDFVFRFPQGSRFVSVRLSFERGSGLGLILVEDAS